MKKAPSYEELELRIVELERQLEQTLHDASNTTVELRKSEEKYRALINTTDTGYVILDSTGNVIDANDEYARLAGFGSVDETLGRNVVEWTAEYDRERNRNEVEKCFAKGQVRNLEVDYIHAGGKVMPVEINATVVGPEEEPIILSICRDITSRREAEKEEARRKEELEKTVQERTRNLREALEELEENKTQLQSIIDNTSAVIYLKDLEGYYLLVNKKYEEIFHAGMKELQGKTDHDVFPKDLADAFRGNDLTVIETGEPLEIEEVAPQDDGLHTYISLKFLLYDSVGVPYGVCGISTDITQRRQRAEEIRRFKTIMDNANYGIAILDLDGYIEYANAFYAELHGYTVEELIGKSGKMFYPEEQLPIIESLRDKFIEEGSYQVEEVWRKKRDGTIFPTLMSAILLRGEGDRPDYMAVTLTDMTKYKKAENALRSSEEKYRGIFDESIVTIYLFDNDKNFMDSNQAGLDLLGYSREELLGMSIPDVDADTDVVLPAHEHLLEGGRLVNYEHQLVRKTGEIITVLNNSIPITDENGTVVGMQSTLIDITKRKQIEEEKKALEQQLLHAQKMEAIGQLAGGIAHDFNNIIATIRGTTEIMLNSAQHDSPSEARLYRIMKSSDRATDLAMKLLTFARKEKLNISVTSIDDIVIDVIDILKGTISKKISIETELSTEPIIVSVDVGQITQVLMNLSLNACDAMPRGGKLCIKTSHVMIEDSAILRENNAEPGEYCVVSLSDTGEGISEENLLRIFEPFFTTKEKGRGSGLGLSVSHGIIKEHHGFFECRSAPGEGSCFNVYIPLADPGAVASTAIAEKPEQDHNRGRVLVIDDDSDFMEMTQEALEDKGFEVLTARTGKDGVSKFSEKWESIDVVMLDMMLPEMGGAEIFRELKKIDPDAAIIICSGYSIEGEASELLNGGARAFVQKPFSLLDIIEELSKAISEK